MISECAYATRFKLRPPPCVCVCGGGGGLSHNQDRLSGVFTIYIVTPPRHAHKRAHTHTHTHTHRHNHVHIITLHSQIDSSQICVCAGVHVRQSEREREREGAKSCKNRVFHKPCSFTWLNNPKCVCVCVCPPLLSTLGGVGR